MARSVDAALRGRAIGRETCELVRSVMSEAMAVRARALPDDRHPAFLHPGRSVLVLLHDVRDLDLPALPIAGLHESQDDTLRVRVAQLRDVLPPEVAEGVERLPLPGDEALEEKLVTLARGPATAVLAERLDHLRHLHLRPDLRDVWSEVHEEVGRAWAPFAERIDPRIAVRFAHWVRTFARRLGSASSAEGQLPRV
jgi:hypothetical protein